MERLIAFLLALTCAASASAQAVKVSDLTAKTWAELNGTDLLMIARPTDQNYKLAVSELTGNLASLTANTFTGTQTFTIGAANVGVLTSTGYSLTGSNATSMIDLAGTWNTSGTPTAIKLNITNTASNASSLLMDLQVGSASKFAVSYTGTIAIADGQRYRLDGMAGSYTLRKGSTQGGGAVISECAGTDVFAVGQNSGVGTVNIGPYSFSTAISATADVFLYRDAAAVLALKNAANAQTFRVYKTTTGPQYLELNTGGNLITVSGFAFTDGAAAQTGTLTNAPAAGNPTKWIPINDNGTTRYIPAW